MKKAKLILSAIALLGAIGSAFSFKKNRTSSNLYFIDIDHRDGLACTVMALGYFYFFPPGGIHQSGYYFFDTQPNSDCLRAGYLILTLE